MRGLDPVRADILLAAVFLVAFAVQALVAAHLKVGFMQALMALVVAVAIMLRRRWMIQALLLVCVMFVGGRWLIGGHIARQGGVVGMIGVLLLFYWCGAFLEGRRAWFGLGISLAFGAALSL